MSNAARIAVPVIGVILVAVAVVLALQTFTRPDDGVGVAPSTAPSAASQPASIVPSPTASVAPAPTESPSASPSPSEPTDPFDVEWASVGGLGEGVAIQSVSIVDGRWIAGGQDGSHAAAAWYSDDGGATWTRATVETSQTGTQYSTFVDVVAFGDVLLASGQWGARDSDQAAWTTWHSTDNGASWAEIDRTDQRNTMDHVTAHGQMLVGTGGLYTGTTPFDSFVVTSVDGVAWTTAQPESMRDSMMAEALSIGERLVVAGTIWANPDCRSGPCPDNRPAVWLSDDGGGTWQRFELGRFGDAQQATILAMAADDDGTLVAVGSSYTEAGANVTAVPTAWISTDRGDTWQVENIGASGAAYAIAVTDRGFVAAGTEGLYGDGAPLAWTSPDGILWATTSPTQGVSAGSAAGSGRTVVIGHRCRSGETCGSGLEVGTAVDP